MTVVHLLGNGLDGKAVLQKLIMITSECDVPVLRIPSAGNFSSFLVVSEPVSEKIGT